MSHCGGDGGIVNITPEEMAALEKLTDAWTALCHMGWEHPQQFKFPPEGEQFELIELGSTGIHNAIRHGEYFWVDYEWPSHPFLVRRKKEEL